MLKRAFTLIELLVVIAIIAILAAILFPVFAQAKAAAKKSVCISNNKQLALGTLMYVNDNDGVYPLSELETGTTWAGEAVTTPASYFGHTNARDTYWSNSIGPYTNNYSIDLCPMASASDSSYYGVSLSQAGGYTYSEMINGYLNQWSETATTSPAGVIMYSEALGAANMPRYETAFPPLYNGSSGYAGIFVADDHGKTCPGPYVYSWNIANTWWVHTKGSDYAYMDGHAKYILNPSAASPWAGTDTNGLPQSLWVDGTAANDGCAWFYAYGPTEAHE